MNLERSAIKDYSHSISVLLKKYKRDHPQRYEILKKEFLVITPKFLGDNLNSQEVSYFVDWGKDVKMSIKSRLSLPEFYKRVSGDLEDIKEIKLVAQRNKTSDEIDEEFWEEYFTEDGAFESH